MPRPPAEPTSPSETVAEGGAVLEAELAAVERELLAGSVAKRARAALCP